MAHDYLDKMKGQPDKAPGKADLVIMLGIGKKKPGAEKPDGKICPDCGATMDGDTCPNCGYTATDAKNPKAADSPRKTGKTDGKSNRLGGGGRAQQLLDKGVPPAVVGSIARAKGVYGHNDFKKGPGRGKR